MNCKDCNLNEVYKIQRCYKCFRLYESTRLKKWRKENPRKEKEWRDKYCEENKDMILKIRRKSYHHKGKIWQKEYQLNNKEKMRKWQNDYKVKNPEKILAYNKSKKIIIPNNTICQECNKDKATEKHHEDYSKPLSVEFLCKPCHAKTWRRSELMS